jgi:hypothetical protein
MKLKKNLIKFMLFKAVGIVIILSFLLLNLTVLPVQPAFAAIGKHEEAPGQILYKSRYRFTDAANRSWQLILFKQVKNSQVQEINLRIVGFPGKAEFKHPEPLTIITRQGKVLQAHDSFAEKSPAANVGQYDVQPILEKLPVNTTISLELNLNYPPKLQLEIPSEVLLEWQIIAS